MMVKRLRELETRWHGVPLVVFTDSRTGRSRCVNGLHVQTFIPSPFNGVKGMEGTIITFASGDKVIVSEEFDDVFDVLSGFVVDG